MTNFDDGQPKHFLSWSYIPGANTGVMSSSAVPFEVKSGKQPLIRTVLSGGTRFGSCNISGNMLKL